MMSAIIGRNPLPDPVISRIARGAAEGDIGTLPYSWDPDYPARLGLLPREGGPDDVRWFEIDPCFVFHTLNAYEDGDTVVVDVVRHDRMFATVLNGPDEGPSTMARFTIDLVADKVREDRFDDHSQEFPRIDERFTGRRHRFGYSVGIHEGGARRRRAPSRPGGRVDARAQPRRGPRGERVLLRRARGRDRGGRRRADGLRLRPGRAAPATWWCSMRRRSRTSPPYTCRRGCPPGFHGSWSPTQSGD